MEGKMVPMTGSSPGTGAYAFREGEQPDQGVPGIESCRGYLQRLAYRMLGSAADAEDIVQEVFIRLSRQGLPDVLHLKAYLVKAVTNRCLNHMRSMKRKKEFYVGPWLPEPLREDGMQEDDPAAAVERRESLTYAYLVMLERLTLMERAVFVLREALGFDYPEIARLIGKSETNCRKLFSRARNKLDGTGSSSSQGPAYDFSPFVDAFLTASRTGDYQPLVRFMLADVTMLSDGGGKVRSAVRPIKSRERVLAFFRGITAKGSLHGDLHPFWVNGQLGLRLKRDGATRLVLIPEADPETGFIKRLYMIRNPDKLAVLQ